MKTMFFTAFYAPAMPIVSLFTVFGSIILYWADKHFLLRKQGTPSAMGASLNNAMISLLEYCALLYAIGNMFFSIFLINENEENAF